MIEVDAEFMTFNDMGTKQRIVVMNHLRRIPSTEWLLEQKFAVAKGGAVVLPLQQPK